jgi:hypothetical protein
MSNIYEIKKNKNPNASIKEYPGADPDNSSDKQNNETIKKGEFVNKFEIRPDDFTIIPTRTIITRNNVSIIGIIPLIR